ncbi:Rha family transcriptional regulator [Bordetella avium]|uniref:Rha family transcriptional regulator n=4 Tax=Bordetella avium TaxID=521 RepID=UPI000E690850|nr:Rha family transcriptional regulator [Bordetella avium]RIQ38167.1 Rha family transcriptional regulator [Bordetella avium]
MDLTQVQDMVSLAGDRLVTDSRRVAEKFKKRHRDVLRAIRLLECSADFRARNFAQCFEINGLANGKPEPVVQMTKDGFMFLVMGFTGRAAAAVKESFIEAFNSMAEYIRSGREGLWQQMHALLATDADSKARASLGSRLMLDRKREKPVLEQRCADLMARIQHPLRLA